MDYKKGTNGITDSVAVILWIYAKSKQKPIALVVLSIWISFSLIITSLPLITLILIWKYLTLILTSKARVVGVVVVVLKWVVVVDRKAMAMEQRRSSKEREDEKKKCEMERGRREPFFFIQKEAKKLPETTISSHRILG